MSVWLGLIERCVVMAIKKGKAKKECVAIPSLKEAPDLWSKEFINFVVLRGYDFDITKFTVSPALGGSPISLISVKRSVAKISKSWDQLLDASCTDTEKGSKWTLNFDIGGGIERLSGRFYIRFLVKLPSAEMFELFDHYKKTGADVTAKPDYFDPLLVPQKLWEGHIVWVDYFVNKFNSLQSCFSIDEVITCLRAGGNPFYVFEDTDLEFTKNYETAEFMRLIKEVLVSKEECYFNMPKLLARGKLIELKRQAQLNFDAMEVENYE